MIYLDNATATPLDEQALKEMLPYLKERFIAPYAPYSNLIAPLNEKFESIKALIGASDRDQILISPSVTISTNAIFFGVWQDIAKEYGKNHFLSTNIEEAAKLFNLGRIEELGGITALLPVGKKGYLEPKDLAEGLSPRSALLSISLVNPILGTIQPMEEIGKLCQERGVLLHVDLTHAVGKIDFSLKDMQADFATFSCETVFGPKNSSALWIRSGLKLSPLILGSDPNSLGQFDPAPFVAFGVAAQIAMAKKQERMMETARIRSLFEKELKKKISSAQILFQHEDRIACTSVVTFPYVTSETLAFALAEKNIYVNMGGGIRQEIGHLLSASQVETALSKCGLSFTFSHLNTEDEIVTAVNALSEIFHKYQPLSEGLFNA